MWMLAPAAATVIALVVLVAGVRSVARAAAGLGATLRRSSATAVAGDELSRLAARLGDHAEATRASADRLRGRASRRAPKGEAAFTATSGSPEPEAPRIRPHGRVRGPGGP